MKFHKTPELLGICVTVAAVFSTFSVGAISASAPPPTAADVRYQQDRADCLAGKTAQGQKTCLKEAGAARQAAHAHELRTADAAQLTANARKRCDALKDDDRTACLARVAGDGTTTGSVAGGGELHELVTVVPGTQPGTTPSN